MVSIGKSSRQSGFVSLYTSLRQGERAQQREQLIPTLTLQVLFIGVGVNDLLEAERRMIESVGNPRPIIKTTEAIAQRAGQLDGRLRSEGNRIDRGDVIICATELVLNEPVLMGNSRHFERIDGLTVETY